MYMFTRTVIFVTFEDEKLRGQFSENLVLWIYERKNKNFQKEKNYESSEN